MNRRTLLAALAAPLAGCGGYAADDNDETPLPTSEGGNEPIDASVEDLLPAADDLDGGWNPSDADDENCREFTRVRDGASTVLTACAWVHDDAAAAETAYDDTLDRHRKLSRRGSESNEEPQVGVEAAHIRGGNDASVVFRDANAVGSVRLDARSGPGEFGEVDPDNAVRYAAAMHERWRN